MTMNMTKIKSALHSLAIRKGWYKDVTTELPLNVCRTVFGVYFFEGSYAPERPEAIFEHLYTWGFKDGCSAMQFKPRVGEWKIRKDGLARYRRVSVQREGWTTESEPIEDMEMVILPPPMPYHHVDCGCSECSGERKEYGATQAEWRQEVAAW